jgi:hypothetical protein
MGGSFLRLGTCDQVCQAASQPIIGRSCEPLARKLASTHQLSGLPWIARAAFHETFGGYEAGITLLRRFESERERFGLTLGKVTVGIGGA